MGINKRDIFKNVRGGFIGAISVLVLMALIFYFLDILELYVIPVTSGGFWPISQLFEDLMKVWPVAPIYFFSLFLVIAIFNKFESLSKKRRKDVQK